MSIWADILGTVSGGGVFGLAGAIAKGWLEIKQHRARMEEKRLDAEIQREVLKLQTDKATIEGEALAFAKSQDGASGGVESSTALASLAKTPGQTWFVFALEGLRSGTRPLLTWGAHLMAFVIFFHLPEEMRREVLMNVFAMASTYGGWWFGTRQAFRFNK